MKVSVGRLLSSRERRMRFTGRECLDAHENSAEGLKPYSHCHFGPQFRCTVLPSMAHTLFGSDSTPVTLVKIWTSHNLISIA